MAELSNPEPGRPVPVQPVLEYASPLEEMVARPAIPGVLRFAGVYAGVLVPAVCLLWSIAGYPFGPEWQSGQFRDYAKLFLSARSAWPFFPLLLYSMHGMLLVCGSPRPAYYARRSVLRFAIYTGVVLAAQFTVIAFLSVALEGPKQAVQALVGGLAGTAVPGAGLMLFDFFARRYGADKVFMTCVTVIFLGALVALGFGGGGALGAMVGVPVIGSLLLATPWALAIYTVVAVRVYRLAREQAPGPVGMAAPAWGMAYAGAWTVAIEEAIRAYHALPTVAPAKCYVASAAARGHRRFVRSRVVGGVAVNDQLRRLKCAEVAMATVAPSLHRAVRRAYDRVGSALAARMNHPLLADLTYAMLKPAEWASVLVLRRVLGNFDELAAGVYSETGDGAGDQD